MPVFTPVPVQTPPVHKQDVLTIHSRNMSQPVKRMTPLRYEGHGKEPAHIKGGTKKAGETTGPSVDRASPKEKTAPVHPVSVVGKRSEGKIRKKPGKALTSQSWKMFGSDGKPLGELVWTVFFAKGSSRITAEDVDYLQTKPHDKCYLVIGRADPTGPRKGMVVELSQARAQIIGNYMIDHGFRVEMRGVGELGLSRGQLLYGYDRKAEVWQQDCANKGGPQSATLHTQTHHDAKLGSVSSPEPAGNQSPKKPDQVRPARVAVGGEKKIAASDSAQKLDDGVSGKEKTKPRNPIQPKLKQEEPAKEKKRPEHQSGIQAITARAIASSKRFVPDLTKRFVPAPFAEGHHEAGRSDGLEPLTGGNVKTPSRNNAVVSDIAMPKLVKMPDFGPLPQMPTVVALTKPKPIPVPAAKPAHDKRAVMSDITLPPLAKIPVMASVPVVPIIVSLVSHVAVSEQKPVENYNETDAHDLGGEDLALERLRLSRTQAEMARDAIEAERAVARVAMKRVKTALPVPVHVSGESTRVVPVVRKIRSGLWSVTIHARLRTRDGALGWAQGLAAKGYDRIKQPKPPFSVIARNDGGYQAVVTQYFRNQSGAETWVGQVENRLGTARS